MKKENITLNMEAEKLQATRRYMGKKDVSIEQALTDTLQKLYEKHVPAAVREYIDGNTEDVSEPVRNQRAQNKM